MKMYCSCINVCTCTVNSYNCVVNGPYNCAVKGLNFTSRHLYRYTSTIYRLWSENCEDMDSGTGLLLLQIFYLTSSKDLISSASNAPLSDQIPMVLQPRTRWVKSCGHSILWDAAGPSSEDWLSIGHIPSCRTWTLYGCTVHKECLKHLQQRMSAWHQESWLSGVPQEWVFCKLVLSCVSSHLLWWQWALW